MLRFIAMSVLAAAVSATSAYAADKGLPPDLAEKELGVDIDKLPDLTREQTKYAKDVGQELVCLCGTCPRHTISNCACGWAQRNKKVIEAALVSGKTGQEIIKAYERVYGLKIRPTPPKEGIGQLSYMVPYAAIGFGLVVVFFIGLRMRKRNEVANAMVSATAKVDETQVGTSEARSILEQELDELDR